MPKKINPMLKLALELAPGELAGVLAGRPDGDTLRARASRFNGEVLVIHGDSHQQQVDHGIADQNHPHL